MKTRVIEVIDLHSFGPNWPRYVVQYFEDGEWKYEGKHESLDVAKDVASRMANPIVMAEYSSED